jgi:hypothetical protein
MYTDREVTNDKSQKEYHSRFFLASSRAPLSFCRQAVRTIEFQYLSAQALCYLSFLPVSLSLILFRSLSRALSLSL